MTDINIVAGDEVIIQGCFPEMIGVVTHNEEDHFCYILADGITYHCRRPYANPKKTGRHFDVKGFLETIK